MGSCCSAVMCKPWIFKNWWFLTTTQIKALSQLRRGSYAKHNSFFHSTTKNGKQNGWYQSYTTETKQQKGIAFYIITRIFPKKPVPFWFPKRRQGVFLPRTSKSHRWRHRTKMDGFRIQWNLGQFMVNPNLNLRPFWVGLPYNHYLFGVNLAGWLL